MVVLVGLLTSLVGTQLARQTIIERARSRVNSNLRATADFILKSMLDKLELKIRFTAGSEKIKDMLDKGDYARRSQAPHSNRHRRAPGFSSLTNKQGQVLARAFIRDAKGDVSNDPVVKERGSQAKTGRAFVFFQ